MGLRSLSISPTLFMSHCLGPVTRSQPPVGTLLSSSRLSLPLPLGGKSSLQTPGLLTPSPHLPFNCRPLPTGGQEQSPNTGAPDTIPLISPLTVGSTLALFTPFLILEPLSAHKSLFRSLRPPAHFLPSLPVRHLRYTPQSLS